MLIYNPLSAYFDDVIPQQPALSNYGKQRQPALGDFTSPIHPSHLKAASSALYTFLLIVDSKSGCLPE
jgi:hypothetical protein